MISTNELRAAWEGSWLLLRSDPQGMSYFDLSLQGFWRSFQVIFLLAPVFLVSAMAEKKLLISENVIVAELFPSDTYWFAQFMSLGIDWVTLPLILALIAGPIGISRQYVPFIVVRNWTSILASMPYLAIALLYLTGIIPSGIMVLLSFTCLIVVLWYRFLIARIALQASVSMAIGIVFLDILLSLVIGELTGRLWAA
ncbi:hypothetical protein [Roseibium sp.]|uniref:hypothetical protein n=1 Tax=Roseibium sp. TaxID=1936156 RepID=UPI00391D17EF